MTGIATSTNTIKTGLCDMPHCKVKYHIRPVLSVLTVHTIDRYKTAHITAILMKGLTIICCSYYYNDDY